jgi:26S proteasome regulatory subunit N3
MDIEKTGMQEETNSKADAPNSLSVLYRTIADTFKTSVERKDSAEIAHLTKMTKTIAAKLSQNDFVELLRILRDPFSELLLEVFQRNSADFPAPKTEEEIFQLILTAIVHFKENRFDLSRKILHGLLFEKPQDLCQRTYLEPLSNYLLYKYLNAVEFSGSFSLEKQNLYLTLKAMQAIKSDVLFSTVYIFLLRNLFLAKNFREVGQLLKNCEFPEHINSAQLCKYLFYKGAFLARTGQISQALVLISESLRKSPDEEIRVQQKPSENGTDNQTGQKPKNVQLIQVGIRRGVKGFKLMAQKHQIVLQLMLNEIPNVQQLAVDSMLQQYRQLASFVTLGDYRSFEELLTQESKLFEKDLVLPLLTKMKSVVLRNALKKLSTAYTKISIDDVLERIGVSGDAKFDLLAFLAKSQEHIEKFRCDPQTRVVDFAKTLESYTDASVRETLLKRIKHIQSLEEQVIRSLKYKERGLDLNGEEQARENEEDEDLDCLNFSFDDLDI